MSISNNKEIKNASWLIGGRVMQMVLSFVVSILTARFLGPSNYGLIGYANAYTAFFLSLCNLGINSIIVKEFIDRPEKQGEVLGTTIGLRVISSVLSSLTITGIVFCVDYNETLTIMVVALCSISLVFQAIDSINYWFQAKYQSKVTAIITLIAYTIVSLYKIILLLLKKNVCWFAFASSLDYICVGILLLYAYKKNSGPRLSFSWCTGRRLLKDSYHYILSGMMVAIYGQTDKLMLKQMLSESDVGYYSLAQSLNNMWVFVLAAIIDSVYPTIMTLYKNNDRKGFLQKNRQLYAIVFYISAFVSVIILIFGDLAVSILYGDAFMPASKILKVITWYTAFSFLGVARNAWVVSERKQRYLKYMYVSAAVLNVVLNCLLIPIMGAVGAAIASLITEISTSFLLPLLWKEMRPNVRLMLEGIILKGVKIKHE